jgi:tRNA pseudouridine55 synthase
MKDLRTLTVEDFLDGQVLLVDKPLGFTSFQAVNALKWALLRKFNLKKIKIGHAGTLDPLASGLLIICTGKFTKKIQEFQGLQKTYTGTFTLGSTTPSYDLETAIDAHFETHHINSSLIEKAQIQFMGPQMQHPPMFSAVKKEGKRLYEIAREGKTVETSARAIEIYNFELDYSSFDTDKTIDFSVDCSKGTYIRSLAHDFGKALKSGAHLSRLRRTAIGAFKVEDARTPDALKDELCS